LRRDLAQLLRRLRALRRERLAYDELQLRFTRALAETRSIGPLLTFDDVPAGQKDAADPEACAVTEPPAGALERLQVGGAIAADCASCAGHV
jgi:hypothetical protein